MDKLQQFTADILDGSSPYLQIYANSANSANSGNSGNSGNSNGGAAQGPLPQLLQVSSVEFRGGSHRVIEDIALYLLCLVQCVLFHVDWCTRQLSLIFFNHIP